jgi:hypothetical protein
VIALAVFLASCALRGTRAEDLAGHLRTGIFAKTLDNFG